MAGARNPVVVDLTLSSGDSSPEAEPGASFFFRAQKSAAPARRARPSNSQDPSSALIDPRHALESQLITPESSSQSSENSNSDSDDSVKVLHTASSPQARRAAIPDRYPVTKTVHRVPRSHALQHPGGLESVRRTGTNEAHQDKGRPRTHTRPQEAALPSVNQGHVRQRPGVSASQRQGDQGWTGDLQRKRPAGTTGADHVSLADLLRQQYAGSASGSRGTKRQLDKRIAQAEHIKRQRVTSGTSGTSPYKHAALTASASRPAGRYGLHSSQPVRLPSINTSPAAASHRASPLGSAPQKGPSSGPVRIRPPQAPVAAQGLAGGSQAPLANCSPAAPQRTADTTARGLHRPLELDRGGPDRASTMPVQPASTLSRSPARSAAQRQRPPSQLAPTPFTKVAATPGPTSMNPTPYRGNIAAAAPPPAVRSAPSNFGIPYTPEEDTLLVQLKDQGISWDNMVKYFQGRTKGSLQVRYSVHFSGRAKQVKSSAPTAGPGRPRRVQEPAHDLSTDADTEGEAPRQKRLMRRSAVGVNYLLKFPDWDAGPRIQEEEEAALSSIEPSVPRPAKVAISASHLLRHRELGSSISRSHQPQFGLRNYAMDTLGPSRFMGDASGDVSAVAWSPDGRLFAAGAVALSDESSMQYNKPKNLLLGDMLGTIRELAEHHLPRPSVHQGVNSTHAMQVSQDPRVFTTVQMVGFSSSSTQMYSSSIDGKVNVYRAGSKGVADSNFLYSIPHGAPVDLLSVGRDGLIATGEHSSGAGSIKIVDCGAERAVIKHSLTASEIQSGQPIYPSALKWGVAPRQSKYLLAGFAREKQILYEEDDNSRDVLGETCLWDGETGQRVPCHNVARNVFDVAWNPNPSPASSQFAVASVPAGRLNAGMHSVVRLFADSPTGLRHQIELECPAYDINDVLYCPYDENLVAAGSTDGIVSVWDIRFAKKGQTPLRILRHGDCLSVVPHGKKRWEVDTGIRFLSWGENHTRLYSGSSDGVVKCWNPYLADEDSHIKDVAVFKSAIMSGAFSPDYCSLLIGEDQARINLLTIGNDDRSTKDMDKFRVAHAPEPAKKKERPAHQLLLEQGEVEIRPMGSLPIRQAVIMRQAPGLPPAAAALLQQGLAVHKRAESSPFLDKGMLSLKGQADQMLLEASRLKSERDELRKKADSFQAKAALQRSERAKFMQSLTHAVEVCTLDCKYTPFQFADDDGEVPDIQRYTDRVPDELRRDPPTGLAAYARGLTAKCLLCAGPTHPSDMGESDALAAVTGKQASKLEIRMLANRDANNAELKSLMRAVANQTATMEQRRVSKQQMDEVTAIVQSRLCQRCGFACFRCGRRARVSSTKKSVVCGACGLAWRADALGYELLDDVVPRVEKRVAVAATRLEEQIFDLDSNGDDDEGFQEAINEIGDGERERYLDMC